MMSCLGDHHLAHPLHFVSEGSGAQTSFLTHPKADHWCQQQGQWEVYLGTERQNLVGREVQNIGLLYHSHRPWVSQSVPCRTLKGCLWESGCVCMWQILLLFRLAWGLLSSFPSLFWGLLTTFPSWSCHESMIWLLLPRSKCWGGVEIVDRQGPGETGEVPGCRSPLNWENEVKFSGEQWRITRRRRWRLCFPGDSLNALLPKPPPSIFHPPSPGTRHSVPRVTWCYLEPGARKTHLSVFSLSGSCWSPLPQSRTTWGLP